jgi:hypothetical protein
MISGFTVWVCSDRTAARRFGNESYRYVGMITDMVMLRFTSVFSEREVE